MCFDEGIEFVPLQSEDTPKCMALTVTSCLDLNLHGVHTALKAMMQIPGRRGNKVSLSQARKARDPPGAMDPVQTMEANL